MKALDAAKTIVSAKISAFGRLALEFDNDSAKEHSTVSCFATGVVFSVLCSPECMSCVGGTHLQKSLFALVQTLFLLFRCWIHVLL